MNRVDLFLQKIIIFLFMRANGPTRPALCWPVWTAAYAGRNKASQRARLVSLLRSCHPYLIQTHR